MSIVLGASPVRVAAVTAGLILLVSTTVYSAEFNRVEWTPGGGFAGDVWTFRCPAGASVFVVADALPDQPAPDDELVSALDLVLEVFDGQGNPIAVSDDEIECAAPILCGASCPLLEVDCGSGLLHSIVVRDAGILEGCTGGGSYLLTVEVTSDEGQSLPNAQVKLGGGAAQSVPAWIRALGVVGRRGPAINDGPVPTPFIPRSEGQLAATAAKAPAKPAK